MDNNNPMFNLTVRPLICDEQLAYGFDEVTNSTLFRNSNSSACQPKFASSSAGVSSAASDVSQYQVYLFNKVGAFLQIQVPSHMIWDSIIMNGLDSIQDFDSPMANIAGRDCIWTASVMPLCS